ncbi:50S ribosomal protein L29 [Candidatus Woesearchaeota archaeon]|jgi:large subunit ribosomal protein L29|nr:50S ribosomal protein L29 [Candidatus Woesearchaeota archaeon]MBT4321733.1 50S ribosomal protein L29 [Candidatus Woesearchaeota archaeon]MBT4631175.1 50S ribosomal protein L29 [Candidatus Woesearchaeota archaeon]
MAIIKKNELIQMDEKSMNEKMNELKRELVKINAQISMGTMPENPGKIKEIRKTIARINTIKRIKEGKK